MKKLKTKNHPWRKSILYDVRQAIFKKGGYNYLKWHKKYYEELKKNGKAQ